ncbi:MAG TPA: PA domain-containing protein, partial [Terriglobales bacterium]|nr:PA domain-containing protein [Terriglobales bacterium]
MPSSHPRLSAVILIAIFLLAGFKQASQTNAADQVFGFRDFTHQAEIDRKFNQSPDPRLAEEHLRILTQAPHPAGSPEDRKTADYVTQKFREAGLDTQIVEYKVLLSLPQEISIDITAPVNIKMHGPSAEHVEGDPYDQDPRILPAYNAYSPSGDAEAEVVYANYGAPQDYKQLEAQKVDVHGKVVIVRYGGNYRGVKSLVAQEHGAAGL